MPKLIKTWEELGKETSSKGYKIILDEVHGCSGWIQPIEETEETEKNWHEHHEYLSTHTFYGSQYQESTKTLQKFGFDVEIDNWDKEEE